MFITKTISTEDGQFKLTSFEENGRYINTYLGIGDVEPVTYWDNTRYLYDTLYPYLRNEGSSDTDFDLFDDYTEEVLEMFNLANELGFFEEVKMKIAAESNAEILSNKNSVLLNAEEMWLSGIIEQLQGRLAEVKAQNES